MDIRFAPQAIRDLIAGDEMLQHMRRVADEIAEKAKGFAPVDEGDYRDSIKVGFEEQDGDGVAIHVYSDDYKAHWVEWGTVDTPAHAPLRRAADATDGVTFSVSSR